MASHIPHIIAASHYLTQLETKLSVEPDLDSDLCSVFAVLHRLCERLEQFNFDDIDIAEPSLLEELLKELLQAKSDFAYYWSLAELNHEGSPVDRGQWQTRFAESTIEFALRLAWLSVARKHKAIQTQVFECCGKVSGLFIFGMGKLGGYDLNFSSDVDLVAYFNPEVLPVPDTLGKSYICHQVLQQLTQFLGRSGQLDFIWRVDWRLRPNASATMLAMSSVAAEEYYFYRASPWHRLALMKARVVAGDMESGAQLLDTLTPFIWRQNLDYRALDELAEIKQRINLEHPSLRAQRQWREPIVDDIAGFNVKLGSGGIREIEFIVSALQLVWGGREHDLRTPHTVTALSALASHKHLEQEVANKLIDSYQTLRRFENAIQIMGNQHTHLIPGSRTQQRNLLTLLKIEHWSVLAADINVLRRYVNQHFEALFAEQTATQEQAITWPDGLSRSADEIIESWENGYQAYGVSIQVRHRLLPLTTALAEYLHTTPDNPSDTIARLHDFFRSLPRGEQYFRLLAESPALLSSIVPPLMHSPPMTLLLKQSPHIIDCYMHDDWYYPQPFDSDYVAQADNYEVRLERLRRFVNEHLYRLYLEFLQGKMAVEMFQAALTDLAEHTLELALRIVTQHMALDDVPITVIGMGKIALRKMSPLSDLDLIFIYDADNVPLELASKFINRLQTAISTSMREGIVYELDTRLRPSGRSGAPTVSVESFGNHHHQRARTWEHIALVSSRIVAGNRVPFEQFNQIKRDIIKTPRNQNQFLKDALKMWDRIATHRVTNSPMEVMNSKLRVGGLMQAEYLAACLILRHGSNVKTDNIEFEDLLLESVHNGCEGLPDIIQFWRIQQLWERLLGKSDAALSTLPAHYCARLLEQSGVNSVAELIAKKARYSNIVDSAMQDFFSEVATDKQRYTQLTETWLETAVTWSR